ncbi:MAG: hypothetical protein ACK5JO_16360 [Halodesulfovibrio sp.]
MTMKSFTFQKVNHIPTCKAGLTLCALLIGLTIAVPVFASMGTGDAQRQDKTMGTFTEGMQLGNDPDTGDTILRSAPSPQNNSGNGTDSNTPPPAINIEITPKLHMKPGPSQ